MIEEDTVTQSKASSFNSNEKLKLNHSRQDKGHKGKGRPPSEGRKAARSSKNILRRLSALARPSAGLQRPDGCGSADLEVAHR
jgi:hypothetical protein